MKAELKNGKLYLEIDINKTPPLSKTGKTRILATTGGNQPAPGLMFEGKQVIVGLNAYFKD